MISAPSVHNRRQQSFVLLGLTLAIFLTTVHIHVTAQRAEYVGFLLVFDHLFNLGLVLALLLLCSAVGLWTLKSFGVEFDTPLEALLFSLPIGCGAISTSVLILGFFSLKPILLAALIALWMFLAWSEILNVLRSSLSIELKEHSTSLNVTIFASITGFMISQALLPPTDWDTLMYHLHLPTKFLVAGRIFLPEDSLHLAYVQLVHMLYLPLLASGSLTAPAVLSVFFALLLGFSVFAFARRFFDSVTASWSFRLLWSSTIVLLTAITPRIDVTLALFLFLTHFALLLSSTNSRFFYLSAVLLGISIGAKHTGVIYGLTLAPVIVWMAWSTGRGIKACLLRLFYFGLISLGISLPWLLKNWWMFEAPLYPLFTQRKIDPWIAFLYSEKFIPKSADPSMLSMLSEVRVPFNFFDLFVNPAALSIEGEAAFYYFSPVLLCLALWTGSFTKSAILNGLMIPAVGYLAALIFYSPSTNLRYLIPVIAPFTLAAVYLVVSLLQGRQWKRKAFLIARFCAVAALFPTAVVMMIWTANRGTITYLMGGSSRENLSAKELVSD